ncbi:hypothetical protein TWF788_003799 [Orbilia oligospora]|uniref:Uncharacterized protein n=1 Tax=Orbilia oligospora TaxID=2813651 RepID=A0A7C8P1A7_ORBOL|nr:hypothetical protein TWF788_003799 [Orbilia oligospora]
MQSDITSWKWASWNKKHGITPTIRKSPVCALQQQRRSTDSLDHSLKADKNPQKISKIQSTRIKMSADEQLPPSRCPIGRRVHAFEAFSFWWRLSACSFLTAA